MTYPFKKALVTGGAGFIGSHLCEHLLSMGMEVICLDNFRTGSMENLEPWFDPVHGKVVNQDVAFIKPDDEHFKGVDVIFHNAAAKCTYCVEKPNLDLLTNAYGTLRVALLAANLGAVMIHASTGSVFGGKPKSYYGVSKLAGENYLRAVKEQFPEFQYHVLRYYHVYGSRQDNSDHGGVIPIFITNAFFGRPITIYGDGFQQRHFTYVGDVVMANILMAQIKAPPETVDVVSDVCCTINDLASIIKVVMPAFPASQKIEYKPARKGDIRHFNISNERLKQLVDISWVNDLEHGIRHYTLPYYMDKFVREARGCVDSRI